MAKNAISLSLIISFLYSITYFYIFFYFYILYIGIFATFAMTVRREEGGVWSAESGLGAPVQGELAFRLGSQAEKTEGLYP